MKSGFVQYFRHYVNTVDQLGLRSLRTPLVTAGLGIMIDPCSPGIAQLSAPAHCQRQVSHLL